MAEGTPLRVWFVNVGHGDCTIVKFPSGRVMMVDISNCEVIDPESKKELFRTAGYDPDIAMLFPDLVGRAIKSYTDLCDDPIDIMKRELPGESIFRFVLTHPDMDHMSGLSRLFQQEKLTIPVENFWDTDNSKAAPDKTGPGYNDLDWKEYQRIRRQDGDPRVLRIHRGTSASFYDAANDRIEMLSQSAGFAQQCNQDEDWNNISQVVRIDYGASSLLLPGDAEAPAQQDILDVYGTDRLRSTILKAPHHGRESGYYEPFAAAVRPQYTIVSVGKKPETDASEQYKKHTAKKVLSTRFNGTIYCELFADGDVRLWDSPKKGTNRLDAEAQDLSDLIAILTSGKRPGSGTR